MKKLVTLTAVLAMALTLIPSGIANAGDADEIIAKYIKAIGGEAAIKKLKNRVTKGTLGVPDMGIEAAMTVIVEPPNVWNEINIEAMGMVMVNGKSGDVCWSLDPMQGNRILEGGEALTAARQAAIEPFLNWKDHFESAEADGEEEVDGDACYKVVMTPAEGDAETVFFSKDSGLIVQTVGIQQGMEVTTTVGDYKEVDGVKLAHSRSSTGGQMNLIFSFDSIEHNVDIEDGKFDLPEEIKALQSE